MRIKIKSENLQAEVDINNNSAKVFTSNFYFYRSLDALFNQFFKKGVPRIYSSRIAGERKIILETKRLKPDEQDFNVAVLDYLQRLFSPANVTVLDNDAVVCQKLRNKLRRELVRYDFGEPIKPINRQINSSLEKLSLSKLHELEKDLDRNA